MKVVTLVRRGMLAALLAILATPVFAADPSSNWYCQACGREDPPDPLTSSIIYVDTGRSLAGTCLPGVCADINHQQSLTCPSPLRLGTSVTEQVVASCTWPYCCDRTVTSTLVAANQDSLTITACAPSTQDPTKVTATVEIGYQALLPQTSQGVDIYFGLRQDNGPSINRYIEAAQTSLTARFCLNGTELLPIGTSRVQVTINYHDNGETVPMGWFNHGETENYVLQITETNPPTNPATYVVTLTPENQSANAPVTCQ